MIPVKLVINNFLSHKYSEIDFEKFNVALVIGTYDENPDQSNGAGKSAIFESIMWALFDKSRHRKKDGIVKRDAKSCTVEFTFRIDDTLYRVIRKRDKIVGESEILFEQWLDDKFKPITCDNDTATNKKIVDTIGVSDEVFVNSVYFRQNDISIFAEAQPHKRKDILKSVLRMDKWDLYQKKATDAAKVWKAKIDAKEALIVPIDKIQEELEKCNVGIVDFKKKMQSCNEDFDRLTGEVLSKKTKFDSIYGNSSTPEDLKRLQKDYTTARRRLKEIQSIKGENDKIIEKNTGVVATYQQHIMRLDEIIKEATGINIVETRKQLLQGRTKDKVLAERVAHLTKDIELGNDCDTCKKPLSVKDKDDIQKFRAKELEGAKSDHLAVKEKLQKFERIVREREDKVTRANGSEIEKGKVALKLSKLQSDIDRCISDNAQLDKEIALLNARNFEEEISKLKSKFDKDECERLENEIATLETQLSDIGKKRDRLNVEYGSLISKKRELFAKEQEQVNLQGELNKLRAEYSVYDKLKHYFGKDGIQAIIIENVIDELENYANNTLSKICNEPTSLKVRTQKETEKGSWSETFDIEVTSGGRTDEFETFSGGEKFRISFALRLALSKILSKRMGGTLQFLLLDEVSSSLDDKGLEMFIGIVKQLGEELKIMVITHDEKLKEMFDDLIIVNKGLDGSRVELVA